MELTTLISLIALFYVALYFVDYFLKSCMNLPYIYFLENLGIRIRPFQVNIFTTILNRPISKLAFINQRLFKIWFSLGAVAVILLLVPSIVLLVKHLALHLSFKKPDYNEQVLQPLIPGFNLPVHEFPYYFFTLFLASIIHELGHAIASVGEDVHINGIGFMFLFVLPGAYVDISKEGIYQLSPFRQLRILCAGVWHNVVLATFAYAVGISLAYFLSPMYYTNKGIYVLSIDKDSPARGINGIYPGNIIHSMNHCPVSNLDDWKKCLISTNKNEQIGFCIPEDIVHSHDETIQHSFARPDGSVECCDHNMGEGLCFELKDEDSMDKGVAPMQPYTCLPPRIALEASPKICHMSSQCTEIGYFCLAPSLKNSSRLIKIKRTIFQSEDKLPPKDVLYLGPPSHLYTTIQVTNYIPKYHYIPPYLPSALEAICDYIVKFSGALAILNLVPCIYLDGYWISGAIVDLLFSKYCDIVSRRMLHVSLTVFGTTLLVFTVAFSLWSML